MGAMETTKASLQEKIQALVQEYGLEACRQCLQVSMDEQQQLNEAILEADFDGFLLVDKDGWIQSCNQAALSIFGYATPPELVGTHIMNLVGGKDPENHKRHFTNPPQPLEGSRIMTHMRDVPAKHKSGVEFRVTVGLCFLEVNDKRQYVAFVRDLTKQKRQDELHRATFEASFDPIVLTDAVGIIQTVNHALLEEFGYQDAADLVGESVTKLLPEKNCSMQDLVGRTDREMMAFRSDGSQFPIKVAVQRIKADHLHELHLVGFIRNITDEKKAMQVTKMQGEVRAQEAKAETERAMTAYFAHELRNPLGAIDSALTTMPEDVANNTQETKELLKSIRLCTTFMMQVMKNLLDVRQLEQGQMALHPNPLDLEKLLSDVHAMLVPSVRTGVDFRFAAHMNKTSWVLGDAHRLRQVLTSVATNAINYTTSGSISLSIQWSDSDCKVVKFQCIDTGPGISKAEQVHLFQRFVNRGGAPGTGLGLAIAKQIVDIMGGTIHFESDPEVAAGSTCVAMLPLPKAAAPEDENLSETTKEVGPIVEALNVLVVDDIKMNRKMVTRRFKKIGPNCRIYEACTGEEALDICQRGQRFDVMIVDNYMEGAGGIIHGTDAVLTMRRHMDIGSLIIGCSGNELEQEFRSAGADFFWGKPLPSDAEIIRQLRFGMEPPRSAKRQQIEGDYLST